LVFLLSSARLTQEHGPTLFDVELKELHFEREAPQRRGIAVSKQVGRYEPALAYSRLRSVQRLSLFNLAIVML
jgi:hypothetical protein